MKNNQLNVGVDTGGTFTDIVFREGRRRGRLKLLSTPQDPASAVLAGLRTLFASRTPDLLTYGTTVATNAMLQRRGATTALVTTAGFEDVLAIGRQARPDLYALEPQRTAALVPDSLRLGITERMLHDGSALKTPRARELATLAKRLKAAGVESIAVCLLHASANPDHETAVGEALAGLNIPVTLSSSLSPEPGEYERTSTVVANAYVRPMVERHIADLEQGSGAKRFRVMQSNGGAIGAAIAAREPVRTMLSGPAGGVAAAGQLAEELGLDRLVTFDMGGTSTDVALIAGHVPRRAITLIGDVPVRTPTIDIHTVGAGGGSIASVDEGGSLKVGPDSAGADPGPACYGTGVAPTATDANVVLGRLLPARFLGGAMTLDAKRAFTALAHLARAMGITDAREAAEGVTRVIEGNMERAIRVITVERGEDPRSATLAAFGGAAGLHACSLAESLGMQNVVVPENPGLFSALGVLDGPVIRETTLALAPALAGAPPNLNRLRRAARAPLASIVGEVRAEGFSKPDIATEVWVRMRYVGQSMFLEVPLGDQLEDAFEDLHRQRFHYADSSRALEVVGLRVTARGGGQPRRQQARQQARPPRPPRSPVAKKGVSVRAKPATRTDVRVAGRDLKAPVYEREELPSTATLTGPALIAEYSSTIWLPPRWKAKVTPGGHLLCNLPTRKR